MTLPRGLREHWLEVDTDKELHKRYISTAGPRNTQEVDTRDPEEIVDGLVNSETSSF